MDLRRSPIALVALVASCMLTAAEAAAQEPGPVAPQAPASAEAPAEASPADLTGTAAPEPASLHVLAGVAAGVGAAVPLVAGVVHTAAVMGAFAPPGAVQTWIVFDPLTDVVLTSLMWAGISTGATALGAYLGLLADVGPAKALLPAVVAGGVAPIGAVAGGFVGMVVGGIAGLFVGSFLGVVSGVSGFTALGVLFAGATVGAAVGAAAVGGAVGVGAPAAIATLGTLPFAGFE